MIDNDFHVEELDWLEKVAKKNGIDNEILDLKIKNQAYNYNSSSSTLSKKGPAILNKRKL